MKLVSWNVNGLRACMQKGFLDFFNDVNFKMVIINNYKSWFYFNIKNYKFKVI